MSLEELVKPVQKKVKKGLNIIVPFYRLFILNKAKIVKTEKVQSGQIMYSSNPTMQYKTTENGDYIERSDPSKD